MKRTVYLPDDLGSQVDEYLKLHPGLTLSTLVQQVLAERIAPPDPRAILELAGIVPRASTSAREWAEDSVVRGER